jgi:hypothetical protein
MLKIKKIKPMFNAVVTTTERYLDDVYLPGGLLDVSKRQGGLKEYQEVVAVGDTVRNIKVGDLVCINPMRFAVKQHQEGSLKDGVITDNPVVKYNFDVILIDDKEHLLLTDRDINFVIEEYEVVNEPTSN